MGLRSGHLSITGAMGPSTSWDPWPRPAARAAVGTQECTQIGENGPSAQPPLACRTRPLVRPTRRARFSVMSSAQNAPFGHVATARMQSAPFGEAHTQNAPFRESDTPRVRLSVRVTPQSASLRESPGAWGLEHVDDPHLTARRTLPGGDERTWERAVHCRSVVNVRDGSFRGEWQCSLHCQTASSVPYRYDQGRVAVRQVRSGSSGSATHTATRRRACWAARRTLPLGVERIVSERSEASGSATSTPGSERQRAVHCHSAVNVPDSASHTATRHRAYRIGTFRGEWQCLLAGTDSEPAAVMPIGEWPNWANALGQPPAKPQGRVAPESAGLGLGPDRTERRSLGRGPC